MKLGYAICDLAEEQYDLNFAVSLSDQFFGIELQIEDNIWDMDEIEDNVKNFKFISVHAPTRNVDLSSLNNDYRKNGINSTINSMNIAQKLSSDIFVIHPVHFVGEIENQERIWRVEKFLDSWSNYLLPHYIDSDHKYKICLENIEYPKYPATLNELDYLLDQVSKDYDPGFVLDVPHIWNTRRIILESEELIKKFGDSKLIGPLHDYIDNFLINNNERYRAIHLAGYGVNPIRTHDTISIKDNNGLREILPKLGDGPIILEIYSGFPEKYIESKRNLEKLLYG